MIELLGWIDKTLLCVVELNSMVAPDKTRNWMAPVLIKLITGIRDANCDIALLG